jgi:cytochrome c biogenesis protein CcdA
MLAGFAFGSAVGMLRERDQLASTLQRLAMMVLGVLAPVLAAALALGACLRTRLGNGRSARRLVHRQLQPRSRNL